MKKWDSGMKQWGSGMSSTLRPSLSSRWCFRLVDLTISFTIKHLAILQMPQFQPPPPLPHFGSPLGAQVRFISFEFFRSFILMFFNRCRFSIHHRSVNHSRTSSMTHWEVVAATPTNQMMMALLDCLLCCKSWLVVVLCCENFYVLQYYCCSVYSMKIYVWGGV
jgi:hypothetical protein